MIEKPSPAMDGTVLTSDDVEKQRKNLVATGSILGAIAASSCCVLPLVLSLLGISGAWMTNLRALQPYQPLFIVLTLVLLGYGFFLVYWKPKMATSDGAVCARPVVSIGFVRTTLWLATGIVILAASFNYWFPWILPFLP